MYSPDDLYDSNKQDRDFPSATVHADHKGNTQHGEHRDYKDQLEDTKYKHGDGEHHGRYFTERF